MGGVKGDALAAVLNTGSPCARITSNIVEEPNDPKPMVASAAWVMAVLLAAFVASSPFLYDCPTKYSIFERSFAGGFCLLIVYLVVRAIWRRTGERTAVSNSVFAGVVLAGAGSVLVIEQKPFAVMSRNELATKQAAATVEMVGRGMEQDFIEQGFMTYDPVAAAMIEEALSDAETQMEGIERRAMRLLKDVVEHYNQTATAHGKLSEELHGRMQEMPGEINEYLELVRLKELCGQVLESNEGVLASVRALPKTLEERARNDLGRGKRTDEMVKGMRTSTMHLINVQMSEERIVEAAMREQELLAREWGHWTIDKPTGKISFQRPEAAASYEKAVQLRESAELMYARAVEALFVARQHPLLTSTELVSAAGEATERQSH